MPKKLLKMDEYIKQRKYKIDVDVGSVWSEPKFICPKCGGKVLRNNMVILTSYPAQRLYRCKDCGETFYLQF